jgi:hypothetical protein
VSSATGTHGLDPFARDNQRDERYRFPFEHVQLHLDHADLDGFLVVFFVQRLQIKLVLLVEPHQALVLFLQHQDLLLRLLQEQFLLAHLV